MDPQTGAGTAKVKQDLRGIQQEASATQQSLNRSFDQAQFDRTIGSLVSRLEQLDKTLGGMAAAGTTFARSNESTAQSLDRMAAAAAKANAQANAGKESMEGQAQAGARMEAALMRVLRAVDENAADQQRYNMLLADAKRLLDAGMISTERYEQVQRLANGTMQESVAIAGQARIGYQQLGFQLGDIVTMWSLGAPIAQIFASQIGQVSQALILIAEGSAKAGGATKEAEGDFGDLGDKVTETADKASGMGGKLGAVASFLAGPWGIALTVGLIALAPFVAKLFESNDALGDAVKKLKEDAAATELAAKAKEAFAKTIEGVTAAVREQNKELAESIKTQRDSLIEGMAAARERLAVIQKEREEARKAIDDAKRAYELQRERASSASAGSEIAALGLSKTFDKIAEAEKRYKDLDKQVRLAEETIRRADAALAQSAAERAVDPIARLNDEYDRQRNKIIEAAVASEKYSAPALARELTQLELRRKAAIEAANAQDKLNRSVAAGVAVFKSREQAVGIAGRELQGQGFRVSENEQFGGVRGNHPGMGNKAHGKYAIDVNVGSGNVEADVPDLKAKFDAAAKRYAARGYKVLWNGNVYWPDGKITPIKGANKHRDHIHLEAPQTIIGRPTQASGEQQFNREEGQAEREAAQAARLEERASDFVGAIVARAASRGLPNNRESQLQADIDEAFADFERRFNRAANFAEKWEIVTALQDADAREVAREFEQAYVKPIERLAALQGKVGIEREILNAKLDETARLGRELRPEEEAMIERGIRQGDQLSRQAQILEQIRGPMEEYRAQIEALNALLAQGDITLTSYNARMAAMAATAAQGLGGLQGIDPGTGMAYEDISAVADENARYAAQLEEYANFREQLLQMGVDYNALEAAAYQQHMANLSAIDQARREVGLQAIGDMAGSMTGIMKDMFGEQSRLYKAAFAAEKAVAIARSIIAIQTGIAQASALPFPANLGAIASVIAATASIVSNIQAVALNFKDGGMVRGPGGPRSDSVPANLSRGEFVVNAAATARNRELLERINAGMNPSGFADGGMVGGGTAPAWSPPGGAWPESADRRASDGSESTIAAHTAALSKAIPVIEEFTAKLKEAGGSFGKGQSKGGSILSLFSPIFGGALGNLLGFADGGYVSGPGGPRSDSIPARLSNGEFVVNARDASRNRPLLEAINSGREVRQAHAGAMVQAAGGAGAQVVVQPNPAPQVHIRQINVTDPKMVGDFFATPEGEQVFVNLATANADLIVRSASGTP